MAVTPNRQPQGIPAGGQFVTTSHSEPDLTLAPAPAKKEQDWHDAAAVLVESGSTPEEANCGVALVLSNHLAKAYLDNGKAALAYGHETDAAMYVIAHSALKDLPQKIHAAGNDQAEVRTALAGSRNQLRRAGSLLDMVHPSGRQPVFRNADEVLARLEEFLISDTEGQP